MKRLIKLSILLCVFMMVLSACSEGTQDSNEAKDNKSGENPVKSGDETVVMMDGKALKQEDLDFYILMEKVKVELSRAEDMEELSGEERDDKMDYWDEQLAQYENMNIGLQSLIEINSMAYLAEEKNYFVPEEKLMVKVNDFESKIEGNEVAEKMIDDYGETAYRVHVRDYVQQSTLRDRVAEDLVEEIEEENPDISEHEQNFLLNEEFEDLYIDQLASLEVEIKLE